MLRRVMRAKIHRATVTGADVSYVGSISLDPTLMERAGLVEYEQVHVLDVDNGARLVTYVMRGRHGEVCLNGAAALLVAVGDRVIIISYADVGSEELETFSPRIVHVDERNREVGLCPPAAAPGRAPVRSSGEPPARSTGARGAGETVS